MQEATQSADMTASALPAARIAHTREGKTCVIYGASGVTAGQLAAAYNLPEGAWREVPEAEALALSMPTEAEVASAARAERDARLAACDWTQMPDAPLDDTARAAWREYRQGLRDISAQAGFPVNIVWPEQP